MDSWHNVPGGIWRAKSISCDRACVRHDPPQWLRHGAGRCAVSQDEPWRCGTQAHIPLSAAPVSGCDREITTAGLQGREGHKTPLSGAPILLEGQALLALTLGKMVTAD